MIHLVFLACGTPSTPRADSGHDSSSIADAVGETMGDVAERETSTADAQGMPTSMEARCEAVDGGPYFYAVFNVPQIQPMTVPRLRASVCNQSGSPLPLPPGFSQAETCFMGTPYWVSGRVAVPCLSASAIVRIIVE